jgi:hypothetical protein
MAKRNFIYKIRAFEEFDKPVKGWKSLPTYKRSTLDFKFKWGNVGMNGVRKILAEWKELDPDVVAFDLCKVAKPDVPSSYGEQDSAGYSLNEMWLILRFSKKDIAALFKLSNTFESPYLKNK